MPRLFTALAVPGPIADLLALHRGGIERARWIDPADYHVTLAFIGDVDDARADDVAEALARVPGSPVTVEITGFGQFGGDRPRAVHLDIAPTPALCALQRDVTGALRSAGVEPEARKYHPHVTVGRTNRADPLAVRRWLDGRGWAGPATFEADRFGLYTARPGGGGGPYDEAVRYPLDGD